MKKFPLFLAFLLLAFYTKAQDLAMVTSKKYYNNSDYKVTPLLEESNYTYKYNGNDVLVVFKNDEHIEYFNNKKYFIRSKIKWTNSNECFMIIQESNLPNFPFRRGSKLHMKIIKVKRGKVFYESTLGGRTWTGKMKIQ